MENVMKKLLLMTAVVILFASAGCNCPCGIFSKKENAESIFAKMRKAIDVSGKQKAIKSALIVYDTHLGKKENSKITLKVKEKTGIRLEIRSGKSIVVKACSGEKGWEYITGKGLRLLNAKEVRELKIEASYLSPSIKFDRLFASAKLDGSEKVDGVDNWKLTCYPYAKFKISSVTMFVDKKTYLVSKTIEANSKNEDEDITTYYGDYEEYNGIVLPFMMVAQVGERILEFKLISAEWNAEIADSEFSVPKTFSKSK
jgi:hypothetical protein